MAQEINDASVAKWIRDVQLGDEVAARHIFDLVFDRLAEVARQHLKGYESAIYDYEDHAMLVLNAFFLGVQNGRFLDLRGYHDLWKLLIRLSWRRVTEFVKRVHLDNDGGTFLNKLEDVSDNFSFEAIWDRRPIHEVLVAFEQDTQAVIQSLPDPTLRAIAKLRLVGYTIEEIADSLEISRRTVERKLTIIQQHLSKLVVDSPAKNPQSSIGVD